MWLPTVLTGRVFTHRLRPAEVAHDVLSVTPDLGPITLPEKDIAGTT